MSTEVLFVIQDVLPGKLNALVKNIMNQMAIDDPNEAVRRINAGEWVVKIGNLLKLITTATVAGAQRFVADEKAIKSANIGWTGENFKKFFVGKTEENVPACAVAAYRLERASLDAPILAELGDKAEVSLVDLFDLIKKQANGEDGILLTNGYANVFYARGNNAELWAVSACWHSGFRCWCVEAYSVGNPRGWSTGRQILSRDS